jgi:DNA-binding response OmpR family regulator
VRTELRRSSVALGKLVAMKLLVVEDDKALVRALLAFFRRKQNYEVQIARDGFEALRMIDQGSYSVVVVDWNLPPPGPDGLELCRLLRARSKRVGILFCTGRNARGEKLEAFAAGADDYLTKPFDPAEFLARVDALGRRSSVPPFEQGAHLEYEIVSADLATQTMSIEGEARVHLPAQQFLLLVHFLRNTGRASNAAELRRVLETASEPEGSTIRTLVGQLRMRLGKGGALLQTVRGIGYGFGIRRPPVGGEG